MRPPPLHTARLALVPATVHDLDALWAVWRDEEVCRFLFDGPALPRERAAGLLASGLAAAHYGLGLWLVRLHRRSDVVGCVGLLVRSAGMPARDPSRDLIEPLAVMLPAAWGRGYTNEALAALHTYAQRIGRAHSLQGNERVHPDQAAMAESVAP
jgi:RimJ/RimL family protein N-acetyltransferase